MYLYFIASNNGGTKTSSGTIENGFIVKTSSDYNDVVDMYKKYVVDDTGCRIEDIAITQFNRLK